jgi:hypothetical protein
MLRFVHVVLLVSCPVTIVGCRDRGIIDDFGTSGYARIEGTVTRANATPLADSGVSFSCGPDSPTAFGWSVATDATGHYFIDVDAPGPVTIPASGALICRYRHLAMHRRLFPSRDPCVSARAQMPDH